MKKERRRKYFSKIEIINLERRLNSKLIILPNTKNFEIKSNVEEGPLLKKGTVTKWSD